MTVTTDIIIGVDGGGTKTIAWLAPLGDDTNTIVLGRGQAGPGNPRAAGFDAAQANIAAAIEAAFADAKLPRIAAAAACFGLAGAGREIEQGRIASWAGQQSIAHTVRVTGDAEPILAAASPDNVGIVLICVTGSLAWGRNRAGEIARAAGAICSATKEAATPLLAPASSRPSVLPTVGERPRRYCRFCNGNSTLRHPNTWSSGSTPLT